MKSILSILIFLGMGYGLSAQYQFIENKGQWNKKVLFKAYVDAGEVMLEQDGLRFLFYNGQQVEAHHNGTSSDSLLDCHAIKLQFMGAQEASQVLTAVKNPTLFNYFRGNNPSRWVNGAAAYERITLRNVYPGIDFELYSFQYKIKYNFIVHPGAHPSDIAMRYLGADSLVLRQGNLHIATSLRPLVEERPYCYQTLAGQRTVEIPSHFVLEGDVLRVALDKPPKKSYPLVVDPTLVFATFSGSTADNFGFTATHDLDGNAYSGGTVYWFGFPVTLGAFQLSWHDGVDVDSWIGDLRRDIGILKYSPDGTKLLYATYLGGSHNEDPHSMVVNSDNELIVFGNTGSSDFPVSVSAFDTSFNGAYDIFLARLSPDGSRLLASTFVGGRGRDGLNGQQILGGSGKSNTNPLGFNYGDEYRGEVQVDEFDQVYVASVSTSDDFPVTSTAFQYTKKGKHDAVVFCLDKKLSALLGATYFGGVENDACYAIGFDPAGNVVVAGGSKSPGLPFVTSAFQPTLFGGIDGILARFDPKLEKLLSGTYFGMANRDQAYFLQTDELGGVHITGQTFSDTFYHVNAKYHTPAGKQYLAGFDTTFTQLHYAATFGSGRQEPDLSPSAFLVDQCGRLYLTGWGGRANFGGWASDLPIPNPSTAIKSQTKGSDFYLAVFGAGMDNILYGSYFGGDTAAEHVDGGTSRYNRAGIVYQSVCAGCGAGSSDFPVTKGVVSETNNAATGNLCNNALFKLDFDAPVLFADFDVLPAYCHGTTIQPINRSTNALDYAWDFGDGNTYTTASPTHQYADTGQYTITLIVSNIYSCPGKDTFTRTVWLYTRSGAGFTTAADACGRVYDFINTSNPAQTFHWAFGDGKHSKYIEPSHIYADTGKYTVRLLTDSGTSCADSAFLPIVVGGTHANFNFLTDSCGRYVSFFDKSNGAFSWYWTMEPGVFDTDNNPSHAFSDTGTYTVSLVINKGHVCSDSLARKVKVKIFNRLADMSLAIDSCSFTGLAIANGRAWSGYKWIQQDTIWGDSLFFNTNGPGLYPITLVADPFSFCPDTTVRYLSLDPLPICDFEVVTDTCLSKIYTLNKSINAHAYSWWVEGLKSTQENPTFTLTDTGLYQVGLVANPFSGCADTLVVPAHLQRLGYALFGAEVLPCSQQVAITNESVNADSLFWVLGPKAGQVHWSNDTLTFASKGYKVLTLITNPDAGGCSDTFEQKFYLPPSPQANFQPFTDTCLSVRVFERQGLDYPRVQWYLDGSPRQLGDTLRIQLADTLGHLVRLEVTDSNGCTDTISTWLRIRHLERAAFAANIDSCTGQVEVENLSVGAFSYTWYLQGQEFSRDFLPRFGLASMPEYQVLALRINDGYPCADSISRELYFHMLQPHELEVPNVISPNGDGKNDRIYLPDITNHCYDAKLEIFNRWGVKVYEAQGKELAWDAKNAAGSGLNPGVYYYFLTIGDHVGHGSITVVR
jgi:gliding motility-associated-like protein